MVCSKYRSQRAQRPEGVFIIVQAAIALICLVYAMPARPAIAQVDADFSYADMSLKELMSLQVFTTASLIPTELAKAPGTAYMFDRDD